MKINISLTPRGLHAVFFFLLVLASYASADSARDNPIGLIEARQIVKERRAVFILIQRNFKLMIDTVKGKREFDKAQLSAAARQMQSISTMLPELFPAGSNPGKPQSNATEAVWNKHDMFMRNLQHYLEMTSQLANNAESMDKNAFKAAVMKLGQECKQCHNEFKSK